MTCGRPGQRMCPALPGRHRRRQLQHLRRRGAQQTSCQFWGWYGRESGPLRYPIGECRCDNMLDGCRQEFQGGWIVTFGAKTKSCWTPSDSRGRLGVVVPPARQAGPRICADMAGGACRQEFRAAGSSSYGAVLRSDRGAHHLERVWRESTSSASRLARRRRPDHRNYTQAFQGGTITVTGGVGKLTAHDLAQVS